MECTSRKTDKATIVEVSGRLDAASAQDFEKADLGAVDGSGNRVILDFSGLEYISSAGLRSLLVLGKKINAADGTLIIVGMKGIVQEVFDISGCGALFPMHPSVEAALEAIG